MLIQLKKAIIVFIFLITIIILLLFENYSLKGEFYNILLVSPTSDITAESLTKIVFDDIKDLNNYPEANSYYTSINSSHLEIPSSKSFKKKITEKINSNDMIVIVGELYNDNLEDVINVNLDKTFVLIENDIDIKKENVYKINFAWSSVGDKLENYFTEEVKKADLKDGEKLNVVYFTNGNEKSSKFNKVNEKLKDVNINLTPIDTTLENYNTVIDKYYEAEILYFINLNFENQTNIIKHLVRLQKDNVYEYYEYENNKEETQTNDESQSDLEDGDDESTEDEEVGDENKEDEEPKFKGIKYLTVYNEDPAIGEYDYITNNYNTTRNIIINSFSYDLTPIFYEMIYNEEGPKNFIINTKNENLEIKKIVE